MYADISSPNIHHCEDIQNFRYLAAQNYILFVNDAN